MTTQQSLVYSPSIQVFVATDVPEGVIDVSNDIVDFELDRVINGVSTFSMTLQNRNYKYTDPTNGPLIETLNRIAVNMTRTVSIQTFSGYVTQAPIITILPNAVHIVAKCTLKRLENTFWDSSIPELRASLLPGMLSSIGTSSQFDDGGTGQGTLNLLTKVVGWQAEKVHIQKIPSKFIDVAASEFSQDVSALRPNIVQQLIQAFDGNGIVSGSTGSPTGSDTSVNTNYGWAAATLSAAGLPVNQNNKKLIVNWMAAENPTTNWWNNNNPLNLNPGKIYSDLTTSAKETGQNIASPLYANSIYATLKTGNATFEQWQYTLQNCPWDDEKRVASNGTVYYLHYPNGIPNATIPVVAVTGTSSSGSTGNPYPNTAYATANAAVSAAASQIGVPYDGSGQREQRGVGFDCSGLTQWSYAQALVQIPGTSETQFAAFTNLKGTGNPMPGDLIYFVGEGYSPPGHVAICSKGVDSTGIGEIIQAPGTGQHVERSTFSINDPSYMGYNRPWANGPTNLQPSGVSSSSSTATAAGLTTDSSGNTVPSQNPLFNTIFTLPQWNPTAIATYGSPQGFIMDEPVLNSIAQVCAASFRSFQSLPNGDFVAWFPDYFGMYGTPAVMEISKIEVVDLSIYHNDDYLTTHVAVAGDTTQLGQQVNTADWLETDGIVSVQNPNFMQILFGLGSTASKQFDPDKFLSKYGMRPYVGEQPLIANHLLEFSYAMYTFMQQWAYQYATQVKFTFMPELYPGMRIRLPEVIIQGGPLELYVMGVTHIGSMTNGYATNAVVTCPSVGGKMLYVGYNLDNITSTPTVSGTGNNRSSNTNIYNPMYNKTKSNYYGTKG